jgi:hypothetical protein
VIAATAIVSIGLFIGALRVFGVIRVGTGVLASAQDALALMRDESLDDEACEKLAQRASLQLFGAFASVLMRSVLTCAVSFLPIGLASLAGLVTIEEVLNYLSRWDVIVITTVVITIGYFIGMRIWPLR